MIALSAMRAGNNEVRDRELAAWLPENAFKNRRITPVFVNDEDEKTQIISLLHTKEKGPYLGTEFPDMVKRMERTAPPTWLIMRANLGA